MIQDGVEFGENEKQDDESDAHIIDMLKERGEESKGISLVRVLKKLHLARTNKHANYMLIVIGIVCLAAALYITAYFIFDIGNKQKTRYFVPNQYRPTLSPDLQKKITPQPIPVKKN